MSVVVAVTRPAERCAGLVAAIEALGAEALLVPLIATRSVAPGDALAASLADAALVALSSASAVAALEAACPVERRGELRVAAVGPATAEALRAAGFAVQVEGDGSGGGQLARAIGAPRSEGDRCVLLAAAEPRPELADGLVELGWQVERAVAYETSPVALDDEARAALMACDVVALASPSAARACHAAGRRSGPVAAIGATTAAEAEALGLVPVLLADEATDEALAAAALEAAS